LPRQAAITSSSTAVFTTVGPHRPVDDAAVAGLLLINDRDPRKLDSGEHSVLEGALVVAVIVLLVNRSVVITDEANAMHSFGDDKETSTFHLFPRVAKTRSSAQPS
jgi:hypothetical protein